MPRQARQKSETGIYHVILRGVNRQEIFYDAKDKTRFLDTLMRYKQQLTYSIYAYCLMDNHLHILIKENIKEIEKAEAAKESFLNNPMDFPIAPPQAPTLTYSMKLIGTSYAGYFNKRHNRTGHLFQDRFLSEPVHNEKQFLAVVRYIHQNPMKAGISADCNYYFSSYPDLLASYTKAQDFTVMEVTTNILSEYIKNYFQAEQAFIDFMNEVTNEEFVDFEGNKRTDEDVKKIILNIADIPQIYAFKALDVEKKMKIINQLIDTYGISENQISRVTGVSRYYIGQRNK